MLIWSIFLTGVVALFFFIMYPRTDYIQTVETPIAQTAIVQFTEQHKGALELALKAVQKAAEREDENYQGSGIRNNTLTIPYPDFAILSKTSYLPKGLDQLDWRDANGDLIQSRIVCINYDAGATATLSTEGTCSIGGYTNMDQTTVSAGTRDYLITYSPKPADLDKNFPGWGVSWADETKNMDTCGIVKNGKIQSPKCPNGLCDLFASENTTRLQNLIRASGLSLKDDGFLEDDGFVCISPIDHYAYDGVSITGKNKEMLAYYDGINNTWTEHSYTTTTWYDLSGNGNNGEFYKLTQESNTNSATALSSVSGWKNNGYQFSGNLEFVSLPEQFNPTTDDLSEQGVEIVADIVEPEDMEGRTFFVGLGNYYLEQTSRNTSKYRFNTMIKSETGSNAWPFSRFLSSAEENAGKFSISTIWKTNHKLMTQDLYLYGKKANNPGHADKFQYKKYDRSRIGAKMRNALGISFAGTTPSYPKRIYVARLYNTRLTPSQIALNYQLDRKRFNMPKVVDNNGKDYTYLQNDGKAYIKTGFIPKGGSKAYIKAKIRKTSGNQDYGGTAAAVLGVNSYFAPFITSSAIFGFYFNSYHLTGKTVSVGNIVESTLTVNTANTSANIKYIINGTSYTATQTGSISTSNDIYLFAGHGSKTDSENATAKIARYTIWQDDVLQQDFIPAEDPFGRPAMYDKVAGKFYYNANNSDKFTLVNN